MEVDSTESITENSEVLQLENEVVEQVTKKSSEGSKEQDQIDNILSNDINSAESQPPECPKESSNEDLHSQVSPESDEDKLGVDSVPVLNTNAETHLESNFNVIENQNNENLERDSEQLENSDSGEPDPHSYPTNQEVSSKDVDTVQKDEKISEDARYSITQDLVNDEGKSQDASLDVSHSEATNIEGSTSEHIPKSPDLSLQRASSDNEEDSQNNKGNSAETEKTSENESERVTVERENCENQSISGDVEYEDGDMSRKGEAPRNELLPGEPPPLDVPNSELEKTPSSSETANSEIEKPNSQEQSTSEVVTSEFDNLLNSKLNKSKANEEDDMSKPSDSDKDIDTAISPTQPLENDQDNSKKGSENKGSGSLNDKDEMSIDSSKSLENQGDNIEFAQVNFDSNENEKDPEESEKEDRSSKGIELDPIGSDVIEPIEEREGADEEMTIIPDTEREITQAEKDAAFAIPPLKDISDAATAAETESDSQETEVPDAEIKIYKFDKSDVQTCHQCRSKLIVKYHFLNNDEEPAYICENDCLEAFKKKSSKKVTVVTDEGGGIRVKNFMESASVEPPSLSFIRKCASCKKITNDVETNLTWEIMDFCNEFCLSKYQKKIGSKCSSCSGDVKLASLGKYCVRFGNDIRQFCTSTCLEDYKKGLKVCSYCQQDMSNGPEGFLAPVGEKGQFKDFCSKVCMEQYDIMTNDRPPKVSPGTICSVCKLEKPITIEFEHDSNQNYFCGEPCFVAFSFVNKILPGKCAMCKRHFNKSILEQHTMYYDNVQYSFCSNSCENIYIIAHRKIVPCSWCKVKKYNFDMIKKYSKTSTVLNMCSINCLSLYKVSLTAVSSKQITCNLCQKTAHPAYHLTMSDATVRNFCSYSCVMSFQNQFPKQPITLNNVSEAGLPVPTGNPQKNKKCSTSDNNTNNEICQLPVISNVQSLASTNGTLNPPPSLTPIPSTRLTRSKTASPAQQPVHSTSPASVPTFTDLPVQVQVKQHFIVRPPPCPEQKNVATMCTVKKAVKSIQTKPTMVDAEIQTDKEEIAKIVIPVPVPIYVPSPCHMFSTPVPFPLPFPLPIPIPIFIPTTRNSAAGIMKEIKKIQVKIPTDPYEAELLMMAEMVAEEKKEENTDSESDLDDNAGDGGEYSPEPVDASNTFGDDMLQMALKMATELEEPAVDLEGALTANTITAPQGAHQDGQEENVDDPQPMHPHLMERSPLRGRKRGIRGSPRGQSKRGRRMSQHSVVMPMMQQVQQPAPPTEPQEKPDANMCLKYTFGVNAWKQWVTTKNAELEKSSRRMKLFKTEILQLTADELNYSLCLFVKEVRKPNGQEYAPDTIYYLCLGIQQYLFENGRIDNIFCDPYYEKFTDCLDEVAKKFSVLYNDSHYIVTRVEEEHLWESKQLGAHSPHVLLSTLMFFNTKHFNLTSVDEHMQLSFSHIMKHWKRNPNQPGASKVPGSRNVLLRFYPPQSAIQNNQRKKKVYEQQENEENPLRCPVKLYEFYLSKCPESVKTRNDVFYLQPERSCVPDSPVWYSTMPLPKEALEKMLHRVKMVKEINVALLTS